MGQISEDGEDSKYVSNFCKLSLDMDIDWSVFQVNFSFGFYIINVYQGLQFAVDEKEVAFKDPS